MATYKITIEFSSNSGWFEATLENDALWAMPQVINTKKVHDTFDVNIDTKTIMISVAGHNGIATVDIVISVETNEDKISLSISSSDKVVVSSDVDRLEQPMTASGTGSSLRLS